MMTLKQIFSIRGTGLGIPLKILCMLLAGVLAMSVTGTPAYSQQAQPPAEEVTPDPWPKTIDEGGTKYTVYQPQLDKWDGYLLEAHAAVSVLPAEAKDPVFGAIEITAYTMVDRQARVVSLLGLKVKKANFPSAPDKAALYQQEFQKIVSGGPSSIALDRLQAALAVEGAEAKAKAVPVLNAPPKFVFSEKAAVLVSIDGDPAWYAVQGTPLQRVINTRALILRDPAGKLYLHLFDGFVQASALSGPWGKGTAVPSNADQVAQKLSKEGVVDLMEGPMDDKDPKKRVSLQSGVPQVIVATTPTELVVFQGTPDWVPIEGTMLLFVKNTTANVFKNLNDQRTYVLVTGRWFRAPDFDGPWQYVAGKDLPADFKSIPDDSPKENVKASVPGTPQSQEAVIANDIPHTAMIDRSKAQFVPSINGSPQLKPIEGTTLSYVCNSASPIIMVSASEYYTVHNGVWFTAITVFGPWTVATSVPAVIYSIPPSSPLYYVTYVKIYDVTPQYVVVGYTPGYMGTVVTPDGVVVYGTGYTYVPYVAASVWFPPPVTYGYAAAMTWTPWTGWAVGFGFGWAMGAMASSSCCWGYSCAPYWGAYHGYYGYGYSGYAYGPHGGAAAWGPDGWAATTGNVYHQWGATSAVTRSSAGYNAWTGNAWSSRVGTSYNSVTGRVSAGQQAAVGNVYTGNYGYGQRGATYNPNTGVSARGGSATVGNAYTGSQTSARWGQVTGPGGQTAGAAEVGNNHYADHDGNVYKNTGSGWEKYDNGSWSSVQDPKQTQSLQAQQQARAAGDQRSAASSWGSSGWGSSFDHSASGWGGSSSWDRGGMSSDTWDRDRSSWGGGGGGSWDRGGGGGGWDRGGGGRWGGGGFGGFHGGGFRR